MRLAVGAGRFRLVRQLLTEVFCSQLWAARRTREIGVRIALGAQARNVLWLVLRETLFLVAIGLAIGLTVALAATRLINGFLFGLSADDPLTIALAVSLMLAVAALAAYLPARRATKVDPMMVLRLE